MIVDSWQADPSTISSSVLSDVRQHDGEAWERLVHVFGPLVYRWCRESGLQRHDAADIVQEVFVSVLRGISTFRRAGKGDTFRGWLRTVTKNKVRDAARCRVREPFVTGNLELSNPIATSLETQSLSEPDNANDFGVLARALESVRGDFAETTWQAFYRATMQGQSAREIGEDLNMSEKAVRQAKYRVLVRLREELEPDFE